MGQMKGEGGHQYIASLLWKWSTNSRAKRNVKGLVAGCRQTWHCTFVEVLKYKCYIKEVGPSSCSRFEGLSIYFDPLCLCQEGSKLLADFCQLATIVQLVTLKVYEVRPQFLSQPCLSFVPRPNLVKPRPLAVYIANRRRCGCSLCEQGL